MTDLELKAKLYIGLLVMRTKRKLRDSWSKYKKDGGSHRIFTELRAQERDLRGDHQLYTVAPRLAVTAVEALARKIQADLEEEWMTQKKT